MADPATILAGVGMAGTAAGGLIQGLGASRSASAAASASLYKAGIAQMNQQINTQNANFAIEAGDIEVQESSLKSKQQIADTEVNQAAGGFDVNTGTNKAVRDSQSMVESFNEGVISWDAAKTAWGFEAKAATDSAEANLDTMAASNQKTAGTLSMLGSFINAGTSVASKWYQGTTSGALSGTNSAIAGFFQNNNFGSGLMGSGSPTGL